MSIQTKIDRCQAYLDQVIVLDRAGEAYPCRHGHFSCAAVEHGPCFDEVAQGMERMLDSLKPRLAGSGAGFAMFIA